MATNSPNMNLPVSSVGVDSGLNWETNLNASLSIIDQHNHSAGQGVQIQPNGLNINSDLPFGSNNATLLRSTRFSPQNSVLILASDIGCLYVVGNELYYNDVTGGHQIQLTSGGLVNATSSGISSGTASAAFSAGTLVVKSSSTSGADILSQSLILTNAGNLTNQLTLEAPTLTGSYTITLPSIPVSTSFTTIDTSGNISGSVATSGGLVGTNFANNVNLPGNSVQENGKNIVVSSANAATSLAIVRGYVQANGTISYGEGFTVTKGATGAYTITFTNSFSGFPAVTASPAFNGSFGASICMYVSPASSFCGINAETSAGGGTFLDYDFTFIAIGPR